MSQAKVYLLWTAVILLGCRGAVAQTALDRLETLLRSGVSAAEPSYLGASADDRGEQGAGVRLIDIKTGSPAERSGLVKNDLITAVAGVRVRSLDDFAAQLAKAPPDTKVRFDVVRGTDKRAFDVTLGGQAPVRPAAGLPAQARPAPLGIRVVTVDEEARVSHGLKAAQGALVTSVADGSTAQRAGLPLDAVIVAVDQKRIDTADDAVRALSQARVGQTLKMSFYYRGDLIERPVTIESATTVAASPPAAPVRKPASSTVASTPANGQTPKPFSAGPVGDERSARADEMERRLTELEQRLDALEASLRKLYKDAGVKLESDPE